MKSRAHDKGVQAPAHLFPYSSKTALHIRRMPAPRIPPFHADSDYFRAHSIPFSSVHGASSFPILTSSLHPEFKSLLQFINICTQAFYYI